AVPLLELREVQAQKGVQRRVGAVAQVRTGEVGHVLIVAALAVRVNRVAAFMTAQVALKCRADVVEFVEKRDELVVEVLVEETGQAEGYHVEHFPVADKIALHLVRYAPPPARQTSLVEPQRRNPRLQAVGPA